MVKALFALAKYLTWWFIKPLGSRLCCKSHTHAANIKFQPNACSSCFKQYFPFLLGGENIHNYFIKSIASSHYFIKSIASSRCFIKSITSSSCCVENTSGDTFVHTLVHDKYSPARLVSQKLRPKSKRIPCYTADCFKSSCLLFVDTMSSVYSNVSGSATWLPICIAKLSRNRHRANRTAWLEWLLSSSVINLVYRF